MFRASYQLPVVFGQETFPTNMQAPTTVRAYVDPIDITTPGADPDTSARRLVDFHAGHISQWVQATRQIAYAGGNTVYGRRLDLDRVTALFQINNGQETLTLYVRPFVQGSVIPSTLYIDIRSIFYRWPIPGSQTHGNPPANWEFSASGGEGNEQGTFYSFYNPPFAPGDRDGAPPVMAVDGDQPIDSYRDWHWEPMGPLDPGFSDGYVEELWLKEIEDRGNGIGGTGFYEELLKGKQYWEVEIRALPTLVPAAQIHALGGTDDGSSYEDPTIKRTPSEYRMKYPAGLNTFLNPVIGVIPTHFKEDFTPPAKSKDYSQTDLDGLPQVPPRDNIRFTHKLIGLDPTTNQPRSIGAVRTSVIMGDEVTVSIISASSEYRVSIGTPYGPLIYESSTASDVFDSRGVYFTTNYVLSGWNIPPFNDPSGTTIDFHVADANPYYDAPDPKPPITDTTLGLEYYFSVADGEVYQIIRFGDPTNSGTTESEGTPSPIHGPWMVPIGGPPPGFLAPGAPAKRFPVGTGPYWRNCGSIGGPWYGPSYVFVITGPVYGDPGSSFPTEGPVTEVRNGSAIPDTTLYGVGGGDPTTATDTFSNQLFGDFLRQPSDGEGDGGTRQPREVVVPFDAGPGRYCPVIKGRGDFMEDHYRDVVTADSNYDKDSDENFGYDTGVDLGDLKVGDRIMFASDTKTGELYVGINGHWKGPDDGPADPKNRVGFACLMDRKTDPVTGELKDAEYHAAVSYKYGFTWARLWLGQGLKYKPPEGYDLLGRTSKPTT